VTHPHLDIPLAVQVGVRGIDLSSERPIAVTFGVEMGTPATEGDCVSIADAFRDNFCNHPGSYPSTMAWLEVVATALDTATSPQATVPALFAGTADPGYANMAGVAEFYCLPRGRSYRGRIHIPIAQDESDIDTGTVTSGWISGFTTILGDVTTALAGIATVNALGVISRKLAEVNPVAEIIFREGLGFIRRRLDG